MTRPSPLAISWTQEPRSHQGSCGSLQTARLVGDQGCGTVNALGMLPNTTYIPAGDRQQEALKSMRSLGGFILLAGIGVALFVYLPAPVDSGASLHRLQRVATSRSSQLPPAKFTPASGLGSFSPSVALSMPARGAGRVLRRQLPHRYRSRRKPPSPATRRRVGRRRSSPPQRLRQLSLRRAIPMHATSSFSTSSSSCGASAAIGAA